MTTKQKQYLADIADIVSSCAMHMLANEVSDADKAQEDGDYLTTKAIIESLITDCLIETISGKAYRKTSDNWRSLIPIIKRRGSEFAAARAAGRI